MSGEGRGARDEAVEASALAPPPSPLAPRHSWGLWILLAFLVALVVVFFATNLEQELWKYLQEKKSQLKQAVDEQPLLIASGFFALYVTVAGLSLPGATVMSLAAGFLFGRWLGTGLVSVASTLGATLAFLSVRYLVGGFVQARFQDRIAAVNRGIDRDGAFYLLSLRLVPLFPFFVVNIAMGLTRMRVFTYWWVSQIGMLPATFLYVNAGTELSNVNSPKDILTWPLLVSFAVLGLAPLLLRKLFQRMRKSTSA